MSSSTDAKQNRSWNDLPLVGPFANSVSASFRELALLPVIAIILVIGSWGYPGFLTWNNVTNNILGASAVLAIVVVAESLLLIAGKFDLSLQSVVALAPMASIILVVPETSGGLGTELSPAIGLTALILSGALVGALNGFLVAYLRLNAFIVTLAMLILLQGVTLGISSGRTIADLPDSYNFIALTRFLGLPLEVWIAGLIVAAAAYFMRYHVVGREIYAIGGNAEAARAAGVKVEKVTFWLFVVAGALSALAGLILSSRIASVASSQGSDIIFTVFAASVVGGIDLNGGRGRIIGAATGVLLLGIIQNLLVLSEVPPFWVTATYGAVILFSMMIGAFSGAIGQFFRLLFSGGRSAAASEPGVKPPSSEAR
jgi:simple sugar transport system permease protein